MASGRIRLTVEIIYCFRPAYKILDYFLLAPLENVACVFRQRLWSKNGQAPVCIGFFAGFNDLAPHCERLIGRYPCSIPVTHNYHSTIMRR
jgi:hypothetical protein